MKPKHVCTSCGTTESSYWRGKRTTRVLCSSCYQRQYAKRRKPWREPGKVYAPWGEL